MDLFLSRSLEDFYHSTALNTVTFAAAFPAKAWNGMAHMQHPDNTENQSRGTLLSACVSFCMYSEAENYLHHCSAQGLCLFAENLHSCRSLGRSGSQAAHGWPSCTFTAAIQLASLRPSTSAGFKRAEQRGYDWCTVATNSGINNQFFRPTAGRSLAKESARSQSPGLFLWW